MNSTNNTVAAITASADIIQEAYEVYVYTLVIFSSTALSFYATLTTFSQEQEHIWFRSFSLPTLLYIFARYGNLIYQGLSILIGFVSSGRSCNILADIQDFLFFLQIYFGVQGLLIIRAYSICQGNKILISALAIGFFSYLISYLYGVITFPGCASSSSNGIPTKVVLANFIRDIIAISTDLLIFGICMWKVWGVWRLKSNGGIQDRSLISVLLTQSILRCCFVITITVANAPIEWLTSSSQRVLVSQGYTVIQNVLSANIVANFTLDLRRLNSAKIEASRMSLPPFQFSNVLQHVHQSFLVEMATPERNMEEEAGDSDHDNLPGSTDSIQAAEAEV